MSRGVIAGPEQPHFREQARAQTADLISRVVPVSHQRHGGLTPVRHCLLPVGAWGTVDSPPWRFTRSVSWPEPAPVILQLPRTWVCSPAVGQSCPETSNTHSSFEATTRSCSSNTASHLNTGELSDGIGASPFSLVVTPNGRLAFVNNTASHDISVIDVAERRVIQRVWVPDVPIVMAVHPSGGELWVSAEPRAKYARGPMSIW